MHLVVLFGPPAVGKMTVGRALEALTGLRLLHNHMTIELVLPFFPFGHPSFERLVGEFRRRLLEEVAASELPGLIFTYVWGLDDPNDKREMDRYTAIFRQRGATLSFVELAAPQAVRLERNRDPLRLAHKPSKRDVAASERNLLEVDREHRTNTAGDFFYPERHIKVDTSALSPQESALRIVTALTLPTLPTSPIGAEEP